MNGMNREIFQYHDGTKERFGDPLVLRDRLIQVSMGELENLRGKVRAMAGAKGDFTIVSEGLKAREHLIAIARETFGLAPFDDTTGKGTLAEDCLAVTESFLVFLAKKKMSRERTPTTSPPTASTPPTPTRATTATTSASS